jgi:hypothetical protein
MSAKASGVRRRAFGPSEGIAIAAVMKLAREENAFGAIRKIVQYTHDPEKNPNLARLHRTMRNWLKAPVEEKIFRTKNDSYAFMKCPSTLADGEMGHSITDFSLRTSCCKPLKVIH